MMSESTTVSKLESHPKRPSYPRLPVDNSKTCNDFPTFFVFLSTESLSVCGLLFTLCQAMVRQTLPHVARRDSSCALEWRKDCSSVIPHGQQRSCCCSAACPIRKTLL